MSTDRKVFEQQFHAFYKFFHTKGIGFKEREAIFLNQSKISIFRGDEFIKFTTNNLAKLTELLPDDKRLRGDSTVIAKYLLENKIIMRMERHPEDPNKKWPRKLTITKDQKLADDSFYTWNIVVKNKMNNVKMGIILLIVFALFLYPIWPFTFKYAVFKLTLYLAIAMVGVYIIRIVTFILFRLVGISFWILPNLDNDSLGLIGAFKPLYSIERYHDGKWEFLFRFVGLLGLLSLGYILYQEPQYLTGFSEASEQTFDDLLEWGKTKLEGKAEPIHTRAIPDLSDLLKDEIEAQQNSTDL